MADRVVRIADGRIVEEHRNAVKTPPDQIEW
jgi:hypothetical protein